MSHTPKIPQRPLVVCLGFLGSKPRYVQKYANIFHQLSINISPKGSKTPIHTNADVVQYIPPVSTFFSARQVNRVAQEIGQHVEAALQTPAPAVHPLTQKLFHKALSSTDITNYAPRKIIFFCLSNNGAFGYANLLSYIKHSQPALFTRINSQTAGVIWDSCPSYPNAALFERGFVSLARSFFKMKPRAHDPLFSPILTALISKIIELPERKDAIQGVTNTLQYDIPYHAPQLFLLTEQDDLVLYEDSLQVIADRHMNTTQWFAGSHAKDVDVGHTLQTKTLQPLEYDHVPGMVQSRVEESDSFERFKNPNRFYSPELVNTMQETFLWNHSGLLDDPTLLLDAKRRFDLQDPVVKSTLQPLLTHDDHRLFLRNFQDSAHVQHIRTHPDEYKQLIESFTEYALRG